MYCQVAVNFPLKTLLTYQVPEGMELDVGDMVDVPLGRRKELGCVLESLSVAPDVKIKLIDAKREDYPRIAPAELTLLKWMSDYYHYPLGQLIADVLPQSKKRPRPLSVETGEGKETPFVSNPVQAQIIANVSRELHHFSRHLIHGVTGSGKTQVYLELIKKTLEQGKSVLYLLPEINLTPQFLKTFLQYLPSAVHTYHSEVTASEKYLLWKRASELRNAELFIGVRSGVFLPVQNLGLIIIDEEHDNSFKQEDRCCYNARDVATKKAQIYNCPIVMGSATPSVESYYQFAVAKAAHTQYYTMKDRAGMGRLPLIKLVDLREKSPRVDTGENDPWPLKPETISSISEAVSKNEQVLLFINRLGFANYVQCRACGHQFHCPNCSVTLRYFRNKNILSCQHCDYQGPVPQSCPKCNCLTLQQKGFGTERVEQSLKDSLPRLSVKRFDRDEIKTFKQLETVLNDFHEGKIQVLVGTQMLSKGHNFERVKQVHMLGIDQQLNFPDFRSQERVYQTLTQVSGRAGRYSSDGVVSIQTHDPESWVFSVVKNADFDGFYENELKLRQLCECPPYFRLAGLYFSSRFKDRLEVHMMDFVSPMIHGLAEKHFQDIRVLGPRPAMVEKKSNQFTWTILVKSKSAVSIHNFLKSFEMNYQANSAISWKVDIDPYHLA